MIDYAVIPLAALLVSSAFAAVALAWDSELRSTASMASVFGCTAVWALVDLLAALDGTAEAALEWLRWSHVGPAMLGPAVVWATAQALPELREPMTRLARRAAPVCLAAGVLIAFVPGAIVSVVPTPLGGWMPRYGWPSLVLMGLTLVLPLHAAFAAGRTRVRTAELRDQGRRASGLRLAIAISIAVVVPCELLLPLLGVPTPRLGALAVAIAASVIWLAVLHDAESLSVTPRGVARSLLADLNDGVALAQVDGQILSTNPRFAEMVGRTADALLGSPLAPLVDVSLDRLRAGVGNREVLLSRGEGEAMPVSLSSSIARSDSGRAAGLVVVIRDLRDVAALRGRLLASGRLAAVGELAAGIAHEINNPVAFVRSDLNLLADRLDEIDARVPVEGRGEDVSSLARRARKRVTAVADAVERIARLVVDVREFAHVGGPGQGGSDPEALAEAALRLARLGAPEDVELRMVRASGAARVEAGQELKQILLSVLRLLAGHTASGGRVDLALHADERELEVTFDASPWSGSANGFVERHGATAEGGLPHADDDLALVVASELLGRLGGRLRVIAPADAHVRVELAVPLVPAQPVEHGAADAARERAMVPLGGGGALR